VVDQRQSVHPPSRTDRRCFVAAADRDDRRAAAAQSFVCVELRRGGLSVRGYHAVNLLIHICAGLALLGIVRRTLLLPGLRHRYGEAALPLAAFAALLWTLHPLQTESVTYISQRAESLMGLFYLLTLYGFIRSVRSDFTEDNEGNEAPGTGFMALCCLRYLL
jgi:hypothetical protein